MVCRRCGEPFPTGHDGVRDKADAEYCLGCGMRRPRDSDRIETDLGSLGGVSDRGKVHIRNEDAMAMGLRLPGGQAAVVCDGISTVRAPELAARVAARTALRTLLHSPEVARRCAPSGQAGSGTCTCGECLVGEAIASAATAVEALSERDEPYAPSCTVVCALVRDPADAGTRPMITVGWVGDSRAYWLADPGGGEPPVKLTEDHSWAAAMAASGELDEAAAMADPRAHIIARWLGPGGEAEPPAIVSWCPSDPGVLLLCTDGLWNYLPDARQLAEVLPPLGPDARALTIAREFTKLALCAGGRDNITVVAIPVHIHTDVEGD